MGWYLFFNGWYHNNLCLTYENIDWYVFNGWYHNNNNPCLADDIWWYDMGLFVFHGLDVW